MSETKLIYAKMSAIMAEVGPIAKERKNQNQGYMFRGIDDVYNTLNSIMSKHGVHTTSEVLADHSEERMSKSGSATIYRILTLRYTFWAADGSSVQSTVVGEGMDSGDKASNKAMAVAHKYALIQAFCVPTDSMDDPEGQDHDITPKTSAQGVKMVPDAKNPPMTEAAMSRAELIRFVNAAGDALAPDEIDATVEKIKVCPDANIAGYGDKIRAGIEQKRVAKQSRPAQSEFE